jgi:CheY-like chemotaxis protein
VQIREAAEQSAELTRELLAVGRRQVLDAHVIDLNHELRRFDGMLRRLVRENVQVSLLLAEDLGLVNADSTQMQRVAMNLAMNAADAMPQGGRLTIETFNDRRKAPARGAGDLRDHGDYVVLRVRDTGHGMNKDTLAKIFDPFFTTKPHGEGTGLGLPTVYGLVQQHGGFLHVESTLGEGTTIDVFLPRVAADGSRSLRPDAIRESEAPTGHGEVVLVVEDDAAVRAVVQDVLRREGYQVIASASPSDAIGVAQTLGEQLDLLVTDVIMPGMNGRELHRELSKTRPALPVLYMSGYPGDVISAEGVLEPGVELLQKPLSIGTLRARVREVLVKSRVTHR